MVYKIVLKQRFRNKLEQTLQYIEGEFGLIISRKFADEVAKKFATLQQQPFIGRTSATLPWIKSIPAGKQNRIYYRIERDKIIVLNMYDTRINPKRNRLE